MENTMSLCTCAYIYVYINVYIYIYIDRDSCYIYIFIYMYILRIYTLNFTAYYTCYHCCYVSSQSPGQRCEQALLQRWLSCHPPHQRTSTKWEKVISGTEGVRKSYRNSGEKPTESGETWEIFGEHRLKSNQSFG